MSYRQLTDKRTPLGGFENDIVVECDVESYSSLLAVTPMYLARDLYVAIT